MPRIIATEVVFPKYYYSQADLTAAVLALADAGSAQFDRDKVTRFFSSVGVSGRHLALPIENYARLGGFAARNAAWLDAALDLSAKSISRLLAKTGLEASEIQLLTSSTVTGIAVPSLDARIMNQLGFSSECRRMPLFGLGCVAGAAGIARVSDYLRGQPTHAAILSCVELCSLTFQPGDISTTNVIASGLFGDGAASVLIVGDEHPLAQDGTANVSATRSVLFPNTERTMGWDVVDSGFQIVLSNNVPELARTALAASVRDFLKAHQLQVKDIARWIAHPGGPAVIDGMEAGLELARGSLDKSRDCLARIGNISSVSVLVILDETLKTAQPKSHEHGLLLAMGPGFCAELVLLQW
jgi:alkylresorcinol/alkylpyrone synthase